MFEVPSAKRVKRSHLFRDEDGQDSETSSRPLSPTAPEVRMDERLAEIDYGFDYEYVVPESNRATATSKPVEEIDENQEPEFQFRLFSTKAKKDSPAQSQASKSVADLKIRLSATPEPEATIETTSLENARFVQPNRPGSYYFTPSASNALTPQYQEVALSSEDVLAQAKTAWPGAALPWRCIQVQLLKTRKTNSDAANSTTSTITLETRKRARPSKKRRTLLKRRQELRHELAAQSKAAEETEREKRTRRNREKKVKRKERDKRKKADAEGGIDDGIEAQDVEGGNFETGNGLEQRVAPISIATGAGPESRPSQKPTASAISSKRSVGERTSTAPSIVPAQRAPTSWTPADAKKIHPTARSN
jgi:hypothetical protein